MCWGSMRDWDEDVFGWKIEECDMFVSVASAATQGLVAGSEAQTFLLPMWPLANPWL